MKRNRIVALLAAAIALIAAAAVIFWAISRKEYKNTAGALAEISGEPIPTEESLTVSGQKETMDQEEKTETGTAGESMEERTRVKGIYVTGPRAGSSSMEDLIQLVDETELNTMVIDVKNDEGQITYKMDLDTARDMGACINYIPDMETLMKTLKEHDIYTIARIVCFKDPFLAESYPELALKKPNGKAVTDANGLAWVNPYREEVWEYLTQVALEAAKTGFDEVQFDYVRFPIGEDADAADYGVDLTVSPKKDAITGFLTYASARLHEKGIPVTADVFGTIIGSQVDVEQVGQDYAALGSIVDVLCPMVYPSHYGNHVFGLDVPDAQPYETVLAALQGSRKELDSMEEKQRAVVRPWLQAFTASWVEGHISYGGAQIREQIQAVYDAGYEEWILWNAQNRYSSEGLETEDVQNSETAQNQETVG